MFQQRSTTKRSSSSNSNDSLHNSGGEEQEQQQLQHHYSGDNSNQLKPHPNSSNNNNSMFQRLFKRFKRNHATPPASPSTSAASSSGPAASNNNKQKNNHHQSTGGGRKTFAPPSAPLPSSSPKKKKKAKEGGDDDDEQDSGGSVSSHSSSYSDYDYLTPGFNDNNDNAEEGVTGPSAGNNNTAEGDNNQEDAATSGDDEFSEYDDDNDDGDSSSSSSYSDYDDYQFLTAVSAAAAARRANEQQQQDATSTAAAAVSGKETDGPPTTITVAHRQDDREDDGEEENENEPSSAVTFKSTSGSSGDVDGATKATSSSDPDVADKKEDNSAITPVELEALARTAFPDFFSDSEDGVPGAILSDGTESSSDEEDAAAIQRKTEKYRTKEDEDVAVFMNLAKRMSLKSLLHLLKGHVQSQRDQYSVEYMKQYNTALKNYKSQDSSCSDFSSGFSSSTSLNSILNTDNDDDTDGNGDDKYYDAVDEKYAAMDPAAGITQSPAAASKESPKRRQHHRRRKQPLKKKKLFRWAEVTGDKVRTLVHEIESIKSCMELWWQPAEMHTIRADLVETVKFYRKRRPGYIQSVEIVARHAGELCNSKPTSTAEPTAENASMTPTSTAPTATTSKEDQLSACFNHQQQVLEDHMKSLMSAEHSYARGLETHIVKMLSDHRKSTVSAVMEEQRECKICGDDYDTTSHCLREQSIAYSNMSSKFAYAIARCDQIEGLKASMSEWKQE